MHSIPLLLELPLFGDRLYRRLFRYSYPENSELGSAGGLLLGLAGNTILHGTGPGLVPDWVWDWPSWALFRAIWCAAWARATSS